MELCHGQAVEKFVAVLEILRSLAAAAHHHVDTDEGVGHEFLDEMDLMGEDITGVATVHELEHLVIATLQRDMEVRHEGTRVGTVLDELVVDEVGFQRTDAIALYALHTVEGFDQVEERLAGGLAKLSDVHACEHNLLAAFACRLFGLFHE